MNSFNSRLIKNIKRLKPWAIEQKTNAYRLYDKDIPEYPYIIEVYGDYVVIYEKGKKLQEQHEWDKREQHQKEVLESVLLYLQTTAQKIIFKSRHRHHHKQTHTKHDQSQRHIIVHEGDLKYYVNLWDYLDTGLFLDHRPLRRYLKKNSSQKKVLNLFSYTCSLGLSSASAGASGVTNVDLSKNYLQWGKENFRLNDLLTKDHFFICQDVFDFLKNETRKYDLITLDPPTFSNSKKLDYDFNVQQHHPELVKLCMKRLHDDGELIFSNNFKTFRLDPQILEKYKVNNWTKSSIPFDFRDQKIHQCYKIKHQ